MGKPIGKKKNQEAQKPINGTTKPVKSSDRSSKAIDEDTAIFINMSQEIKEEGNKLFQKRDHEGAMLKYEKAIKLLPQNHIDVAYLRSNMAECYMQLGLGEYPRAINQCNLALEIAPKYSKALLKRARCYEALNQLNLAYRDVNIVLSMEPKNLMALEIFERLRKVMAEKGIEVDDLVVDFGNLATQNGLHFGKVLKEKTKKKKGNKNGNKKPEDKAVVVAEKVKVVHDKEVTKTVEREKLVKEKLVKEKPVKEVIKEEKLVTKSVKFAFGDDIRLAQLPMSCSIELVREVVRDRFPGLTGVLVKYRDQEGDLITITTTGELRLAETLGDPQSSLKLYVVEASPDQELAYKEMKNEAQLHNVDIGTTGVVENGNARTDKEAEQEKGSYCIEDWLIQFARLFKNHVGFDSDSYLDLHEIGMKLHSEAMEDIVTNDEAQGILQIASEQFQEMTALALFNWGNIHMSKARKRVAFSEDESHESILVKINTAYEWALKEYAKAGIRYEEAMKIKPDFYEGLLAHGQQQFEQAKLCWNHAIASKIDLDSSSESGPSSVVLQLYNKAEDNMERGVQMWEEMEEQRLNGLCKFDKYKAQLQKMGLDGLFKDVSADEATDRATHMRSQIYFMWGSLLYERSVVEYKLGLPTWEECLEVAVEKFEFAGASPTDIAIMIKNHCSNEAALEGVGFKIDELVQAWNEMYDAKRWDICVPSFRLEPLFRRRAPKLHYILENL